MFNGIKILLDITEINIINTNNFLNTSLNTELKTVK